MAIQRNTILGLTQDASASKPRCVFDLNDVTFVDKAGEKPLRALAKQHVKFEASGIYVRGVLSQVPGKRTLS